MPPLNVFLFDADGRNFNVDVEDVENVVDVKDEDFYLVNISYKSNTQGDVVIVNQPEIMEDSTVTKFSVSNALPSKLTTGGTEYKAASKMFYDADSLEEYYDQLLTDITYTVYMDQYGYFIGVEVYEGEKNYVFITGFDRIVSNLSVKTADAVGIFLDGTMDQIKVNVSDTDKNIGAVAYNDNGTLKGTADASGAGSGYFVKWSDLANLNAMYGENIRANNGLYDLNRWFTYTVNANGVYTLKPATRMNAEFFPAPGAGQSEVIKTAHVNISDNRLVGNDGGRYPYSAGNIRSYGNDASVYLTVDLDEVDTSHSTTLAITDVNGVYTGVQNVEIEINTTDDVVVGPLEGGVNYPQEAQVFSVFDKKGYVIGAVVIGEGNGSNANIVYRLSDTKSEEIKDGVYYWDIDIFDGEKKTVTIKSKDTMLRTQILTDPDRIMKLRYDTDGYVVGWNAVTDIYTDYTSNVNRTDDYDIYYMDGRNITTDPTNTANQLTQDGNTLYVTANRTDVGLALLPAATALTIQDENRDTDVKTAFTSVKSALSHLADADDNTAGLQYSGVVIAALDSNGAAKWVIFDNDNGLLTGRDPNFVNTGRVSVEIDLVNSRINIYYAQGATQEQINAALMAQLEKEGYDNVTIDSAHHTITARKGIFNTVFTYGADREEIKDVRKANVELKKLQDQGTAADPKVTVNNAGEAFTVEDIEKAIASQVGNGVAANATIVAGAPGTVEPVDAKKNADGTITEGTDGKKLVEVELVKDGIKTGEKMRVWVTIKAKSYANSAAASNLTKAITAINRLSKVVASSTDTSDTNKAVTAITTLVNALPEIKDVATTTATVAAASKAEITAANGTAESGAPFSAPTVGTKGSPNGTDGYQWVTVTLTDSASTEKVTARFTLKAKTYSETDAGRATAAVEAMSLTEVTRENCTTWGLQPEQVSPVNVQIIGKTIKATGTVEIARGEDGTWNTPWAYGSSNGSKSNTLLVATFFKGPAYKVGDTTTAATGYTTGNGQQYTIASDGCILGVTVPFAAGSDGVYRGGSKEVTVQFYKDGFADGNKYGDPIVYTFDATGVVVNFIGD